jgi:hypothetical protein
MKSPFISRAHHEAESSRLKDKLNHAAGQKTVTAEKLCRMTAKRDQERKRAEELEQLCEARLRAIEQLQTNIEALRRSRMRLLDETSRAQHTSSPYKGPAIPTILGVDVEPDARVVDLGDPSWRATSSFFAKAGELRKLLSNTAGSASMPFTWFPRADPQVEKANGSETWALEHFAKEWAEAKSAGDEIGLHMHPWQWNDRSGAWCQDHANEAWVLACVHSSLAAYRRVFGTTPSCYRGGDRYLSNAVVQALEEEGVKVDMTLERMPELARLVEAESGTGTIPDGTRVPQRAYRPSTEDFRIADPDKSDGLGILSLTSYHKGSLPLWLPNIDFENALEKILEAHEEGDASNGLTHLAFVVRSNIADSPLWMDFVENTLSLARRVREGRLVFATASETWNRVASS